MLAALIVLFTAVSALADDRFTVCSVTINSDDEIRLFKKYLPASEFRFVELTAAAEAASPAASSPWLANTCDSGVSCDMLVVSGHFGNTWAGNYGTTFAGSSGMSLALTDLEQRRCDESCPGVVSDPLEVFLFGCKTLNDDSGGALSGNDVAALARHDLSASAAARLLDEAENGGEDSSSRRRMQFVFGGVPRLYGFTDVAPAGRRVAPLLENYLQGVGDYAAHLRSLRAIRAEHASVPPNDRLAHALEPTCFTQTEGLDPHGADYARSAEACAVGDERRPIAGRGERVAGLLDSGRFLGSLSAIDRFLARNPVGLFDRGDGARVATRDLLGRLENPVLRLELLRVARRLRWVSDDESLAVERQVVLRLLRAPVYGEGRDLICGLGADSLSRIELRDEDVPLATYGDEYGIQALGCLKPSDERIRARLAQSASDSRDWIARSAATALSGTRVELRGVAARGFE